MNVNPNVLGMDYAAVIAFLWAVAAYDYQAGVKDYALFGETKRHPFWLRIAFFVLCFMAAFRAKEIANDTSTYYSIYKSISIAGISVGARMEKGYVFLNYLISLIFRNQEKGFHILQILVSVFCYYSVERYIEKNAHSYGVAILVFYFLSNGGYMSAIRQSLATAIILFAISLLRKKKRILYILVVALAAQFHASAWIALLFLVLYGRKFNLFAMAAILGAALLLTAVNMPAALTSMLNYGTWYIKDELDIRPDFFVKSAMSIALLALRLLLPRHFSSLVNEEEKTEDSFYSFCIVMSFTFTILSLRAPAITRFGGYASLVGLPYIPNTLYKIENKKESFDLKVIYCGMSWAYSLAALIFRPEWQHLWPYRFFWME